MGIELVPRRLSVEELRMLDCTQRLGYYEKHSTGSGHMDHNNQPPADNVECCA